MVRGKTVYNKIKLPPLAFLICFVIAFSGWALFKLSKIYTVSYSYAVNITDLPANYKEVALSDSTLVLTFQAKGIHFISSKYSEKNRVIDLSVKDMTKLYRKKNSYTFNNKNLTDYIKSLSDYEEEFVQVKEPESLTIDLQ
ncbi:MAG: hypothetical protein LBU51_08015 [Bacteroidales bacterium]|jgi:hypothetical protein|nr:hypothetical protein [Bacteroidales bacterium]